MRGAHKNRADVPRHVKDKFRNWRIRFLFWALCVSLEWRLPCLLCFIVLLTRTSRNCRVCQAVQENEKSRYPHDAARYIETDAKFLCVVQ